MCPKSPDLHLHDNFTSEIADINREFMRLLIHPAIREAPQALGLNAGLLAALWQLTPAELDEIGSLPLLLPEFHPFPVFAGVRDVERPHADSVLSKSWQDEKRDFVNRLLTCIWQNARRDRWRTSLYVGISPEHCHALAEMNFCSLGRCTHQATELLRVRLCEHENYWPDLISSIRKGDSSKQAASRLALIPLSIAQSWKNDARGSEAVYL
jgi:hypothetical protein